MIQVKDWPKFQHFKDRRPPWIKLYRDILDDPEYHGLDGDSAKYLILMWLIASDDESKSGYLPDREKLAFRLRINPSRLDSIVSKLSHWLIQDDIGKISERYHFDTPEGEGETEGEKRESVRRGRKPGRAFAPPTIEDVSEYCKARNNNVDPTKWHSYYTANGWKVGRNPMRDWQAAVRTWEKQDGFKGEEGQQKCSFPGCNGLGSQVTRSGQRFCRAHIPL